MSGNRLETEPVRGLFWSMAVPVILQQLLIWLDNVIDRIWIAHIPDIGQLAFTASAVCVPIIYMIMALAELTGTGIAPQVGYHLGQGNRHRAEQTLGSFFLFNLLLAMVGDVGVGTMALVIMLYNFFYFPFYGMAFGVQSITSYNIGANRWDRVRENVRMLMKVTLVWSVVVWLLMMLFTQPVVQLIIGDGEMTDYSVLMVRLSFVVFFISTLQFACQSTLQAMNRPKLTFWLGLSRTLLVLLPLVWLLPHVLPGHADAGVFLARPITDMIIFAVTAFYLYKAL